MSKKIIMACMALVALAAFALPATASAANNPLLTHPTGTAIPAGTKITATQVGSSFLWNTSNSKLLECSTGTMTGELKTNSGGTVEGNISSAVFGGTGAQAAGEPEPECTALSFFGSNTSVTTQGLPWCVKSTPLMAEDEFTVSGGACGGAASKIKFKLAPTGISECEYEATNAAIKGTFDTDTGGTPTDALLTVKHSQQTGFKRIAGGFLCPESGEIEMTFTLETDKTTKEPIYIS
jgi:hypothetical protein